jgi:hypothetical protein
MQQGKQPAIKIVRRKWLLIKGAFKSFAEPVLKVIGQLQRDAFSGEA